MYQNQQYEFVINGHYLEIWATLKTPSIRETAIFSLKGKSGTFNISMSFSHNNVDYKMSMSIVRYYQRINIELVTPLTNSRVIFDFGKETKELKTLASLTYGSQLYELVISNLDHYRSFNIKLTTPSFTNTSLSYTFKGSLKSFTLQTSFTHNHDQYKMSVSNKDYFRQTDGKFSTPYQRDSFSFNLNGDLKTFDVKTTFKHNNDHYELTISNRDFQQITCHLKTPLSEDSFTFLFDGSLTNFTTTVHALYNKNQYVLSVSSSGYYREIDAELTSPFVHCSAMFSLNGHLESFRVLAKAAYNSNKYQIKISNKGYTESIKAELIIPHLNTLESNEKMKKYEMIFYSSDLDLQFNLRMLTPLNEEFIDFTYRGNSEKFNAVFTIKHNATIYDVIFKRDTYHQINFRLNMPFVACEFRFDWSKGGVNADFQINVPKAKHEVNASDNKHSNIADSHHRFRIKTTVYYKENSITGEVSSLLNKNKIIFNGNYKRFEHKKIIKADVKTPYFKDQLHIVIAGTLQKFDTNMKLQHNKDVYELIASNKNYYDELDLNLIAPGIKVKFQFEGNIQKCKVSASLKMANELYEVILSNQNFQNINLELSTPQTGKCTFDISINKKIDEYRLKLFASQIIINGHLNGDFRSFSFNAKTEKYEIMASTSNYFREISAKLTTPQFGEQSLTEKINGQLSNFDGFIEVKNNNEVYRSEFSLENNEFKCHLSLPKLQEDFHAKFLSCGDDFEMFIKLLHHGQRYEINLTKIKALKNFIIISHWGSINASMNGDLKNSQTKVKMLFGKNVFDKVAQIQFDGKRLNIDVKIMYEILSRSGLFDFQVSNIIHKTLFKSKLGVKVEDVECNVFVSFHKVLSKMNAVFIVSLPTTENSEIKLRYVSEGIHKISAILNLNTPWTKISKIYYEHDINSEEYISGKAYMEQNEFRLLGYSVHAMFNRSYSFDFKCDYNNYRNKFLVNGDLKFHGSVTTVVVRINTSFGILKELSINTKISRNNLSYMLNFTQQKRKVGLKLGLNTNSGSISLDVNVRSQKNHQYQLQTSYKNNDQLMDIFRTFDFKIVHPVRTVEGRYHLAKSQYSIVMAGDLMWDKVTDQKAGFELTVRNGQQNEGKFRIITPRCTIELFGKVEVNGNHYSTVGHIMMDENNKDQKIDIKADIMESSNKVDIDLTVKFPNQKKVSKYSFIQNNELSPLYIFS